MKLHNKKTGEIVEIKLKLNESLPDAIRRTIEEAGWEETREPLIKDEKVCKAVQAWAEANGIDKSHYHNILFDRSEHRLKWIRTIIEFDSIEGLENLCDGAGYTIAELCGEEEMFDTIADLDEEWEDYKPTEPLIEDEKSRKVFQEWVKLYGAERFRATHCFNSKGHMTLLRSTDLTTEPSIELPGHIGKDSEIYTKIELVGDKE